MLFARFFFRDPGIITQILLKIAARYFFFYRLNSDMKSLSPKPLFTKISDFTVSYTKRISGYG